MIGRLLIGINGLGMQPDQLRVPHSGTQEDNTVVQVGNGRGDSAAPDGFQLQADDGLGVVSQD